MHVVNGKSDNSAAIMQLATIMFTFYGLKAGQPCCNAASNLNQGSQYETIHDFHPRCHRIGFFGCQRRSGRSCTLSQAELGKLFPGSFQAVVSGAVTVKITARGNGTLIGQMTGQEDRGRWSVKSGKLCIVWSNWLNGKASCSRVIADDGWYRGNGVKFRKI